MLYRDVRTEHLEKCRTASRSDWQQKLIYRRSSYDWHPAEIADAEFIRKGIFATCITLLTHSFDVVEVNEPAMWQALPATSLFVACVRIRDRLRTIFGSPRENRRSRISTFCIENIDPTVAAASRLGRALGTSALDPLIRWVTKAGVKFAYAHLDRIAFGTHASLSMYKNVAGELKRDQETRIELELPTPCGCGPLDKTREFVFVGQFSTRKGFQKLLEVWDAIEADDSMGAVSFHLVGKGELQAAGRLWSERGDRRMITVDPPRERIHELLRSAEALFLFSESSVLWREQVGLPIKEALAHGCTVVTSDATGLASWLESNGHIVVAESAAVTDIARSIQLRLLARPPMVHESLNMLPAKDERDAVHLWMREARVLQEK